ncbi:MAG: glycosyltransferase family 4 protein, partial [Alphaproteobacteria bacterium]|nr:glycosyltransferase family 4 protein [Alphaproteobacteria bacterium]
QRVLARLAEHWTQAGRRVAVVTLAGPDGDFHRLPPTVRRIALGVAGVSSGLVPGLVANLRRIRALRRALRATRARVVVSLVGPTNVLTVLAARGLGCRVVVSERNDPARQSFGRIWDRLRRLVYPRADLVTANSRGALAALAGCVPASRLAYVPNPLDFPRSGDAPERDPLILAVGRLHRQKAFDVLLDAFARIAPRHPDWRLAVVGDGDEGPALRSRAQALGIAGRVDWAGIVDDVAPWYRRAAVFALPSRHEGMPNALLEAMAHGLPPVISDALPGPLDLIVDGDSGLVTRVGDAADLATALARLIDDASLRRQIGAAARARIATAQPAGEAFAAWDRALGLAAQPAE